MTYFCKACGTEADNREICSGCGSMMVEVSGKHMFAVEIVDQVVSRRLNQPVVYARVGPFIGVAEADGWWKVHQDRECYTGCSADVVILEPPYGIVGDESSN
jgi:hypothetical protein